MWRLKQYKKQKLGEVGWFAIQRIFEISDLCQIILKFAYQKRLKWIHKKIVLQQINAKLFFPIQIIQPTISCSFIYSWEIISIFTFFFP